MIALLFLALLGGAQPPVSADVPPPFDEKQALAIVAMPLSCTDHPEGRPPDPNYLYTNEIKPRWMEDYDKNRAFYGCYDWHSSVNSIWTMAVVLKRFPRIPIASLIREKLNAHLSKDALAGEVTFFKTAKDFEQPYGRAWILKLDSELISWDDPDARKWRENLAPLRIQFASGLLEYMKALPFVNRTGVHGNTAFSMQLLLDYAAAAPDPVLYDVVANTARQVFQQDVNCPVAYEPSGPDFLSPCLEEAKAMSRVLPQVEFVAWLNKFMPAPDSAEFKPLTKPFDSSVVTKEEQLASKSHLIGLAFDRAEGLLRVAAALPKGDARVANYRRIAEVNAAGGFHDLAGAGYLGSHWLGTAALRYELARDAR